MCRSHGIPADVLLASSFDQALGIVTAPGIGDSIASVFVIGGSGVFREALAKPQCEAIELTLLEAEVDCDTFIPEVSTLPFTLLASYNAFATDWS